MSATKPARRPMTADELLDPERQPTHPGPVIEAAEIMMAHLQRLAPELARHVDAAGNLEGPVKGEAARRTATTIRRMIGSAQFFEDAAVIPAGTVADMVAAHSHVAQVAEALAPRPLCLGLEGLARSIAWAGQALPLAATEADRDRAWLLGERIVDEAIEFAAHGETLAEGLIDEALSDIALGDDEFGGTYRRLAGLVLEELASRGEAPPTARKAGDA